jgi:hypothetical protein
MILILNSTLDLILFVSDKKQKTKQKKRETNNCSRNIVKVIKFRRLRWQVMYTERRKIGFMLY